MKGRIMNHPVKEVPVTPSDLIVAEMYLDHIAAKAEPVTRAKARFILATIAMLDATRPEWRKDLLKVLTDCKMHPKPMEMFPLPEMDTEILLQDFMTSILHRKV